MSRCNVGRWQGRRTRVHDVYHEQIQPRFVPSRSSNQSGIHIYLTSTYFSVSHCRLTRSTIRSVMENTRSAARGMPRVAEMSHCNMLIRIWCCNWLNRTAYFLAIKSSVTLAEPRNGQYRGERHDRAGNFSAYALIVITTPSTGKKGQIDEQGIANAPIENPAEERRKLVRTKDPSVHPGSART